MAAIKSGQIDDSAQQSMPYNTIDDLWWLAIIQGIVAIFFGIAAIFWPGLTLATLVYLIGAFVLVWGIIEIVHGFLGIRQHGAWWLTLIFGFAGLGVGVYLIRHPHVSFSAFIIIVGLTLILRGLFDIVAAFIDRHSAVHTTMSAIVGVAAILAGIILFFQPRAGGVAFVWLLGLYALIYGTLTTALAVDARNALHDRMPK